MMHGLDSTHSYWLAALRLPGIGVIKFRKLLAELKQIEAIFSAQIKELQTLDLTSAEIKSLKNPDWKTVEKDLRWCEQTACKLVTLDDESYPKLLRDIPDAPLVLFLRGKAELLSKPQIAMVGTRSPTSSGYETAAQFARYLAKAGFVITSGLASGIDTACHQGALEEGETIAVLGTGLQHIYPKTNQQLAEKIIEHGALISEFNPDEGPKAHHFPRRNRIISGLSLGVVVVEAALRSGSLITARNAVEQGREVFAIPGSIHNPVTRGCHHLIRQGAKLVETADDIIEELSAFLDMFQPNNTAEQTQPSHSKPIESNPILLSAVGFETTSLDTIIARSGLTASEVSSMLLFLELEGYVQTVTGGYARTQKKGDYV